MRTVRIKEGKLSYIIELFIDDVSMGVREVYNYHEIGGIVAGFFKVNNPIVRVGTEESN